MSVEAPQGRPSQQETPHGEGDQTAQDVAGGGGEPKPEGGNLPLAQQEGEEHLRAPGQERGGEKGAEKQGTEGTAHACRPPPPCGIMGQIRRLIP